MKARLVGIVRSSWTDKSTGEVKSGLDIYIIRNPRGEREVRETEGQVAEMVRVGFLKEKLAELKIGQEYDFEVESGSSGGRRWKTALDVGAVR
jgi:hypothetical protein